MGGSQPDSGRIENNRYGMGKTNSLNLFTKCVLLVSLASAKEVGGAYPLRHLPGGQSRCWSLIYSSL